MLAREGAKSEDKGGYNVIQVLTRTTLDIIGLAGIRILFLKLWLMSLGFGYDIASLKDENNPIAQAYFTIFDNSPETLFASLMMALYPFLEHLPFSWIKRTEDAKVILIDNATQIINAKVANAGGRVDNRDILGCMLHENERLRDAGETGLSNEEMISQILTFLAAG